MRYLLNIIASLVIGLLMLTPLLALIGKAWLGLLAVAVLGVAGCGIERLSEHGN